MEYFEVGVEGDRLMLIPVKTVPSNINLEEIRGKVKKLGLSEKGVGEAVRWARES